MNNDEFLCKLVYDVCVLLNCILMNVELVKFVLENDMLK